MIWRHKIFKIWDLRKIGVTCFYLRDEVRFGTYLEVWLLKDSHYSTMQGLIEELASSDVLTAHI